MIIVHLVGTSTDWTSA
jgi:3-oxo-5-alpha-steroid 4-dehydrogenase 3